MDQSSGLTGLLDLAIAKASQLPAAQQDRLATEILLMISGEEETVLTRSYMDIGTIITFLNSILPAGNLARTITLLFCVSAVFVQAPAVVLFGVSEIVRSSGPRSRTAPELGAQAGNRPAERRPEGGGKATVLDDDARRSLARRLGRSERANQRLARRLGRSERVNQRLARRLGRSERVNQRLARRLGRSERAKVRLEAWISLYAAGVFDEKTIFGLARDPAQYETRVLSEIDRAIAVGPEEVSTKLNRLKPITGRFATKEYTVNDVCEYYHIREEIARSMREAIVSGHDR